MNQKRSPPRRVMLSVRANTHVAGAGGPGRSAIVCLGQSATRWQYPSTTSPRTRRPETARLCAGRRQRERNFPAARTLLLRYLLVPSPDAQRPANLFAVATAIQPCRWTHSGSQGASSARRISYCPCGIAGAGRFSDGGAISPSRIVLKCKVGWDETVIEGLNGPTRQMARNSPRMGLR